MTPDQAYEWLAPKLSDAERRVFEVVVAAAKANPAAPLHDGLKASLERRLVDAARTYQRPAKTPKLDAQEAIALIEAACQLAQVIEARAREPAAGEGNT